MRIDKILFTAGQSVAFDWDKKIDLQMQVYFLVGAGGFGPPKSLTTDLQSAPFGRSGTLPYNKRNFI